MANSFFIGYLNQSLAEIPHVTNTACFLLIPSHFCFNVTVGIKKSPSVLILEYNSSPTSSGLFSWYDGIVPNTILEYASNLSTAEASDSKQLKRNSAESPSQ